MHLVCQPQQGQCCTSNAAGQWKGRGLSDARDDILSFVAGILLCGGHAVCTCLVWVYLACVLQGQPLTPVLHMLRL